MSISSRVQSLRGVLVGAAAIAACLGAAIPARAAPLLDFASFVQKGTATGITWKNNVVPEVTKFIPAVTKTTPAVTKVVPAVTQFIPAVTKIVKGKVVVVTAAHAVVVTPAHTVVVTPAKTVIVTPAHTIVVTPAHDGTSGSLFSTTQTNAGALGVAKVQFKFVNPNLAKLGALSADLTFNSDSPSLDPAIKAGSLFNQYDLTGGFSFIYTGAAPLHVWDTTYLTGANLLSGDLGGFDLSGVKGGTSASAYGTTEVGDTVTFTSDFLDFIYAGDEDFTLKFTSATPALSATTGAALHTFSAKGAGRFGTTWGPRLTAVPEPATWALTILGLGGVGGALRTRRRRGHMAPA